MENLRHRMKMHFVANEKQATAFSNKPGFKHFTIFTENLTAVCISPTQIVWNKPTPVGATILERSKLVLYNFHYIEMKKRYSDKIRVLYKDTDSLLYRVETEDLYRDMCYFKHLCTSICDKILIANYLDLSPILP